ncbi:hypothetical protein LUZ60_012013 [Juncus effusus]|nr:hypothetical protein LUZ60_012013 [Juncus effusus]
MSLPSPPRLIYHSCEAPLTKLASSLLRRHVASPETTLRKTRQLHALLLVSSLSSRFLFNNLLSLYSRSCSIKDVRNLFDRMEERTVVSYNTVISACSRECYRDASVAFSLFFQMAEYGVKANGSTFASLVRASSSMQEPRVGFSVHGHLIKSGFLNNGVIQTALICMYGSFGCMETADKVFDEMGERDVIAWNSIIHCNITRGRIKQGLYQFNTMISEDLMPNNSSYSMAVNACARTEDLNNGRIFHAKVIKSELELDLPLQNALLDMYSSCVKAAERVILTDPFDGSAYIMLCKLYALNGDWEKVAAMRKRIREMKIEKEPGLSWIEIKNEVRVFRVGDVANLNSDECKKELVRIQENMKVQEMDEDTLLGLVVL